MPITITTSASEITVDGGELTTPATPENIISSSAQATLVAPKIMRVSDRHLRIKGHYNDTGWTVIYSSGRRFIADGSTTVWTSGLKNGKYYYDGATHIMENMGTSDSDVAANSPKLLWYGVKLLVSVVYNESNRIKLGDVNNTSEIVVYMEGFTYFTNAFGTIALSEFTIRKGYMRYTATLGNFDKLTYIVNSRVGTPITWNQNVALYNAGGTSNDIVVNNFSAALGTTSIIALEHNRGNKKFIFPDLQLPISYLRPNKSNVNFIVSNSFSIQAADNAKVFAKSTKDTKDFGLVGQTDPNGVADFSLDVYLGSNSRTGGSYDLPNVVEDYTDITLFIVQYGLLTSQYNYSFDNSGKVVAKEPLQVDKNITEADVSVVSAYTFVSTADELYDLVRQKISMDFTPPDDLITVTATSLVLKAGWTLKSINGGSGDALDINATTKIMTVKLGDTGLLKTSKFDTLAGTIDPSLDGNTNMSYIKSNGKVPVSLDLTLEAGSNSPVFGVWPKSQGLANRTGILTAPASGLIDVTPGTEMYFVADAVNAYRGEPMAFNAGTFGNALTGSLRRIKKVDGTNLLPDALLVAQKRIADMMNYNQAAARVDITLPSNYTTDERWDSASNTWTFKSEDFWPLAYKAEQIQSSEGSLIDPSVVTIDNFKFTLSIASSLTFRQDVNNPECVINMNAFIIKRQGDTEQANTFVDHSNGVILVNAGSLIIADVITPAAALTAVVDAIPGKVNESTALTTLNENVIKASKLIPAG